jgi:hypothetical protein
MQLHLPEGKTQGPESTALNGVHALALLPPVHLNTQARADITWCSFAQPWNGTSILPPQLLSHRIYYDAWGAGALWGTLPMASVVSWDQHSRQRAGPNSNSGRSVGQQRDRPEITWCYIVYAITKVQPVTPNSCTYIQLHSQECYLSSSSHPRGEK